MMEISAPVDMHVHFRQGEMLRLVAPFHSVFEHVLAMPNTNPPILTPHQARAYAETVERACGAKCIAAIKLLPESDPDYLAAAQVVKMYPEGVTTNSSTGITAECIRDRKLYPLFDVMQSAGTVLSIHGEMPGGFCMHREGQFLPYMEQIARTFPRLKIVLEHVSTAYGVETVRALPNVAATITLHHLLLTLDDVVGDRLSPHNFCKPVAKTPGDRRALWEAATGGHERFFFGSDSAPHDMASKERAGCAGCFTAPCLLEQLAEFFWEAGAPQQMDGFVSAHGRAWYGLGLPTYKLTLVPGRTMIPDRVGDVRPFRAGQTAGWRVER